MKRFSFLALSLLIVSLFFQCKKSKDSPAPATSTTTPATIYYAKFDLEDTTYNFRYDNPPTYIGTNTSECDFNIPEKAISSPDYAFKISFIKKSSTDAYLTYKDLKALENTTVTYNNQVKNGIYADIYLATPTKVYTTNTSVTYDPGTGEDHPDQTGTFFIKKVTQIPAIPFYPNNKVCSIEGTFTCDMEGGGSSKITNGTFLMRFSLWPE